MNRNVLVRIVLGVICFVIASGAISLVTSGGHTEREAITEAETAVKSYVYRDLGGVPDRLSSKVIYKNSDSAMLVAVDFALDSGDWMGSYCVYVKYGAVISATSMMGAEYDFKSHLEEVKALFAVQ